MQHNDRVDPPDPPLDAAQRAIADASTAGQLARIDRALLAAIDARGRTTAWSNSTDLWIAGVAAKSG